MKPRGIRKCVRLCCTKNFLHPGNHENVCPDFLSLDAFWKIWYMGSVGTGTLFNKTFGMVFP